MQTSAVLPNMGVKTFRDERDSKSYIYSFFLYPVFLYKNRFFSTEFLSVVLVRQESNLPLIPISGAIAVKSFLH